MFCVWLFVESDVGDGIRPIHLQYLHSLPVFCDVIVVDKTDLIQSHGRSDTNFYSLSLV